MAGSGVTLYALTSAGNKAIIGTIDWREDIYMPSQINDNVAQIMADMRAMANAVATGWIEIGDGDGTYTATYVSATSFRFDGVDVTAYYRAGMRVRVVAPTPGTISGTILTSAFATHTTLTVAWDTATQLSNEAITSVSLGVGSGDMGTRTPSYRNILGRNGGFEVWQRGAGGSAVILGGAYTADGWYFVSGGHSISQQAGLSSGSRWCARMQRIAGQTGINQACEFPLDTDEAALLSDQIVTLSFTARAGANFSAGSISAIVFSGTGAMATKRSIGAYTNDQTVISASFALTATATRYVATATVSAQASVRQASLYLSWTSVGTAGAADYFEIDDVQLEVGSTATPFERRPFESELAACQRHYWKSFTYATAPGSGVGGANSGEFQFIAVLPGTGMQQGANLRFPVSMRVAPTTTTYNPLDGSSNNAQVRDLMAGFNCSGTTAANVTQDAMRIYCSGSAATAVGNVLGVHVAADGGI